MRMSNAPISASEPSWSRVDAAWERLQQEAGDASDHAVRRRRCRRALELTARPGFGRPGDPRRAASLMSLALISRPADAARLLREALAAWDAALIWIDGMTLAPRARSSLFHLRLEAKHPGAYAARERARLKQRVAEARTCAAAAAPERSGPAPPTAVPPGTMPAGDARRLEGALHVLAQAWARSVDLAATADQRARRRSTMLSRPPGRKRTVSTSTSP
jgi:hypothetical protein